MSNNIILKVTRAPRPPPTGSIIPPAAPIYTSIYLVPFSGHDDSNNNFKGSPPIALRQKTTSYVTTPLHPTKKPLTTTLSRGNYIIRHLSLLQKNRSQREKKKRRERQGQTSILL